jgi:iron complex outermembrane receptor protein
MTNQLIWAAVSRAVRAPSRIDTEFFVPGTPPFTFRGGGSRFDSEKLIAYELGYRTELSQRVGVSLSAFYNDFDDIRSVEPIRGQTGQFIILNGLRAEVYGAELSVNWKVLENWRLRGGYTVLKKNIFTDGSRDVNGGRAEGNDPQNQFVLQSLVNLPRNFEVDTVLRYVDNLNQPGPTVPAYFSLDARVAWHPTPNWEIAVMGQNLLDPQHPEYGAPLRRQEIPRGVYGKVTWKF